MLYIRYLRLGTIIFAVQNRDTQGWFITMQAGPPIIAFANPAFIDAFAVRAAAIVACVLAGIFDFHETGMTLTLTWCHAVAIIAIFAAWYASTCVSELILRDPTPISFGSDSRIFEDESIVAFANFRCDACAIVTR